MCEVKVQNHRSLGCTKTIFYEFYRIIKISKIREFLFTNFKTIGHEFSTCAHWPLWLKAYSHGKRPKQAGVSFTRRYDVVSRTARLKCLLSFCHRRRLPHTGSGVLGGYTWVYGVYQPPWFFDSVYSPQ